MIRILLIALLALAPGCKKASKASEEVKEKSPISASRPISSSAEVLATLQLPSLSKPGIGPLLDIVEPGASAGLPAQLPMMLAAATGLDLGAVDLDAPIAALLVDPQIHARPVVLLVTPKKLSALETAASAAGQSVRSKASLALVGDPAVLEAVESFAFSTLSAPSTEPVAVVYPAPLAAAYKGVINAALDSAAAKMAQSPGAQMGFIKPLMALYGEMIATLGEQSDRLEIRAGVAGDAAEVYFRLRPKSGTTLAAFTAAQRPATGVLLEKLPAQDSSILMYGELHAGGAQEALEKFSTRVMAAMPGGASSATMHEATARFMKAMDGRFVMAMDMGIDPGGQPPRVRMSSISGTTDAAGMREAWRALIGEYVRAAQEPSSPFAATMKFAFKARDSVYEGVEIDRYSTSVTMPEDASATQQAPALGAAMDQVMHTAVFDDVAVMAMSSETSSEIESLIDAWRGKGPRLKLQGSLRAMLELSQARKESVLMVIDVAAMTPEGVPPAPVAAVSIGLGKEGQDLNLRLAIR